MLPPIGQSADGGQEFPGLGGVGVPPVPDEAVVAVSEGVGAGAEVPVPELTGWLAETAALPVAVAAPDDVASTW